MTLSGGSSIWLLRCIRTSGRSDPGNAPYAKTLALKSKVHHMKITTILLFLGISNLIFSQTINFSGIIGHDTAWNYDTVNIIGDVNVNSGSTLRIRSGTIILFQGNYKISSMGRIIAIGEKNKNIVFSIFDTTGFSFDRSQVGWAGVKLQYEWDGGSYGNNNTNDSSVFQYCVIEYSRNCALTIENFSKIRIANCIFRNNYGRLGSGIDLYMSSPIIDSCMFINNYGGAIHSSADLENPVRFYPKIINSVFINNYSWQGGAIDYSGYIYLINNIFSHNSSTNGGAIYFFGVDGIIANNLFCNNEAIYVGGAIYGGGNNSDLLIANNDVCNNRAEYAPGIYLDYENYEFINNIVWNNKATGQDSLQINLGLLDTKISVFNCLIEDYLCYDLSTFNVVSNNIYGNPSFLNPTDSLKYNSEDIIKNWSLDSNSVCIDKGTNVYNNFTDFSLSSDVSGKKRICNNIIDIGALEYQTSNNTLLNNYNIFDNIKIFPNPSNGIIHLMINESKDEYSRIQINIYNSNGSLIYCKESTKKMVENIDISEYKGLNILEVIFNGNVFSKKILIK